MRRSNCMIARFVVLAVGLESGFAQQRPPADDYVSSVQKQIVAYISDLADMHCTEHVTQQKLDKNGHASVTEKSKYDYLIMMMGDGDDFELNESRREIGKQPKPGSEPMLISNGIPTALLVFHPYYRASFDFALGPPEVLDGHEVIPIRFQHLPGRRTPLALALRNREFPIDMEGTAWVDRTTGSVVRIEAHLQRDMSDIGLTALQIRIDYSPVSLKLKQVAGNFPSTAIVDVTTPRQHWRDTHVFEDYRGFSTDASQDPSVVVHESKTPADSPENKNNDAGDSKPMEEE